MHTLPRVIRDFLNDPSNDYIALLAALVLITWGIAIAINRWDAFAQRSPHDE
jgi:hypothetical protein